MVRLILIKAYAFTTKCCGHGAKSYTTWEEFTYVSGGTIKLKIHEHGDFVSVTSTDDFKKYFHNRK